ncbi:MAG: DNA replication/repair protein RecF [Armatimonadetes bacterium]|nr:MAG: DNA replication/repair protein RecF [Armatimonadota bacterium]
MILRNLHLTNFRNFKKLEVELPQAVIVVGDNAQGKTNLLEAIYFLATSKSLRTQRDAQLIKQQEDHCWLEGEVEESQDSGHAMQNPEPMTKLEIGMQVIPEVEGRVEKRVRVNGVPRRMMDYVGHLVVVYFSPEDINLVTGSPSLRRQYMDLTLSQIDRDYKKASSIYSETLTARNRLLKRVKEGVAKISELDFWTNNLIEAGNLIGEKREKYFHQLNTFLGIMKQPQSLGKVYLSYQRNIISQERINEYLPREVEAVTSLIGPHRDDFAFELKGHNLAYYGSRGEQRTAVLELKLAELKFVKLETGMVPVLLLDDIFSELDETHRRYVISILGKQQTILTAVETEEIPGEFLGMAKVIRVEKGILIKN